MKYLFLFLLFLNFSYAHKINLFITNENNYNKYTKPEINTDMVKQSLDVQKNIYDSMTVFEKWIYFLFKKDIR